jgi:ABC-type sugar transport system, permease component
MARTGSPSSPRIVLAAICPRYRVVPDFPVPLGLERVLVGLTFGAGSKDVAPMTVRLAEMVGTRGSGWEVLTAGAFVAIIVPLIVFFTLQRYFVRGLLAGSVKG